ncbi:MAG TPA: hypothetical protein VEY67_05765 [Candidatus Dormibacteraeota bacterium]|nr:hypothetical protein [Candidatus Dormibacteraeota bacterium]
MPNDRDAWIVVVSAVWHGRPAVVADPGTLGDALTLARRNDVDGPFLRAYEERLPVERAEVEEAVARYRANLAMACGLLRAAGVAPILIKASPADDVTYSNFDLVVGDDGWDDAVRALRPWVVRVERYPLERGTKLLLYPPSGPAVHLHRSVGWFDVPAIPTEPIRARALVLDPGGPLVPAPVDALRIQLAHAVFQNQSLSLGELLAIRDRLGPATVTEARALAAAEGWPLGFDLATRTALAAVERLDALERCPLPAPLPIVAGVAAGVEHALHLARTGRAAIAARELLLRGPLVAAKQRRLRLA